MSIDLAALESAGHLWITENHALTGIDMPALTSGYLDISYNDCLSQTEAEATAEGLDVAAHVYVDYNGANYPCD